MLKTTLVDRALIRLSGPDVRGFLQGLVTNDVTGPLPVWAGLLTPQGKALFDFVIWADGADLLIDCESNAADSLMRRLSLYRLRRPITIERVADLAVHWAVDGDTGGADPRGNVLGRRWIAPMATGPIGAGDASAQWLRHRLAQGLTEGRAELGDGTTLWLECNAERWNGVSFTKGCYIGQENTARMHHRSKVNRHLAIVQAPDDPGEGARVWYADVGLAVVHQRIAEAD